MKKLLFLLLLVPVWILSQTPDCFQRANRQQQEDMKSSPKVKAGDTIPDDFIKKGNQRLQSLIGCQFPDSHFTTVRGKEISTGKIQSDYVIVLMSMFYCDMCNNVLPEYAKLKKEFGSKLTVLAIMDDSDYDFNYLISTYEDEINFVANAKEWIYEHNAGNGVPVTFLLDKSKLIKLVESGAAPDNSQLMNELRERMN